MGIEKSIASFEEMGYSCQGDFDKVVVTPRGSVYPEAHLYHGGCPLCEGFFEDNPDFKGEVVCSHSKENKREIEESKVFLNLIYERERLELCACFGI